MALSLSLSSRAPTKRQSLHYSTGSKICDGFTAGVRDEVIDWAARVDFWAWRAGVWRDGIMVMMTMPMMTSDIYETRRDETSDETDDEKTKL